MYNLEDKKMEIFFYKRLNYVITIINIELIVRFLSRVSMRKTIIRINVTINH